MENTITETPRAAFDRGFQDGHDHARRDMIRDLASLLEQDPHYACGYSRGIVWFAGGWPAASTDAPWNAYVDWLHESAPALAAELFNVVELTA